MEIVHVYTKLRSDFGRQCLLSDRPAELLVDVPPDQSLAIQFIQKTPRDQALQACRDMSEHQVSFTFDRPVVFDSVSYCAVF